MTETLYRYIGSLVQHLKVSTIWDLYCGIGVLTQYLSRFSTQIIGVDIVEDSISHALQSSQENHCNNIHFIAQDVKCFVDTHHDSADLVLLDPPRRGVERVVLDALIRKNISTILYISCSPQSLGRDASILLNSGYKIDSCKAFDCFTHTIHVETVVCFIRV